MAGNVNEVRRFGDPLSVIGDLSRSMIVAALGKKLTGADFNAIESRLTAWFAGEEWKLETYREFDRTGDPALEPYCRTASKMLGRTVTPADEEDRGKGKVADLAWGFGGGVGAWRKFVPDDPRSDAEIKRDNENWRDAHPETVRFWRHLESMIKRAIRTGHATHGNLEAEFVDGTCYVTLPSGRRLSYPQAHIVPGKYEDTTQVAFMDNGKGGWVEFKAWHGTFAENVISGTARDLLVAAMVRLEAAGYRIVLHTHDEAVAEVPEDFGSTEEFLHLLLELPAWAAGLPVAAKPWTGIRYAKSGRPVTAADEEESENVDLEPIEPADPVNPPLLAERLNIPPPPPRGNGPALDAALEYIARGWNPVPVAYKSKKPSGGNDWQKVIIDAASAPRYFNGATMNVGLQLGPASCGLTDVDLDCEEAIAIAPAILPATGAIFGRKSKPGSHRLYYTTIAQTVPSAALFYDAHKGKGGRLLELRIGADGHAAQTVAPPSTHESDETVRWEGTGDPAMVDDEVLRSGVERVAAYALLARHWPDPFSGHHHAALVAGGFLARTGMNPDAIEADVRIITEAAGSSRCEELSRTGKDAALAHLAGKTAYGMPALCETFGQEPARRIATWLHYAAPTAVATAVSSAVTLDDFRAHTPTHSFIYMPLGETWSAAGLDSRLDWIPMIDRRGMPVVNRNGEQKLMRPSMWLEKHRPVEQMTWAPGFPQLIPDRLVSSGGWIDRKGTISYNLYLPPTIPPGDPAQAGPWIDHVRKVFGDDANHIIDWLAHRAQRPTKRSTTPSC
jgi:Bifunctional DNA primase/polymerase, N-terminal